MCRLARHKDRSLLRAGPQKALFFALNKKITIITVPSVAEFLNY